MLKLDFKNRKGEDQRARLLVPHACLETRGDRSHTCKVWKRGGAHVQMRLGVLEVESKWRSHQ